MRKMIVVKRNYRPDIDGLRALAVLAVIIFHINHHWLPGGYLGVDLFFVISGYLITTIIYRQLAEQEFLFKEFYARRIRRILPLFFTVIFMVSIVAFVLMIPDDYKKYWRSVRYAMQFVANQAFINQDYFDLSSEEKPLLHLWSLAIEEQFYFFWPLILFLSFRLLQQLRYSFKLLFWLSLIGIIVSTLIANQNIESDPNASYFLLRNRASELLVGCILALNPYSVPTVVRGYLGGIGLSIILVCFITYNQTIPYPGTYALIPTIATSLFILDTDLDRPYKRFFTLQWVRLIGLWSFSLYLWHWPILAFMRYILQENELPFSWIVIAIILTFLFSIASYYLIENPIRYLRWSFKQSFITILILPIVVIVVVYQVTKPYQSVILPIDEYQVRWFQEGEGCYDRITDDCSVGSKQKDAKRYLLVGDSHAAHLAGMLDIIGKQKNIQFDLYTAGACPVYFGYSKRNIEYCAQINRYFEEHWQDYNVILFAQYYRNYLMDQENHDNSYYLTKLAKTIDKISLIVPVVLISDLPNIGFNPVRARRIELLGFTNSHFREKKNNFNDHKLGNQLIQQLSENNTNTYYWDIEPLVAELFEQDSLIYRDQDHLNPYGSSLLGKRYIKNKRTEQGKATDI